MALTEDQIKLVKQGLQSSFWNEIVRPAIAQRGNNAIKLVAVEQAERAGEWKDLSDAQLRAIIKDCEWMLTCWNTEIAVFEHNRRLEELDAEQNGANLRT